MTDVTPRQHEVYRAVHKYVAEHQKMPTNRELALYLSMNHNGIRGHLKALARKGWIEQLGDGKARGMKLAGYRLELVKE